MSGSPQQDLSGKTGSHLAAGGDAEMGGGGGNFIAGVFIQAANEKMSIYEAMVRGLLTPGTALVLLEAQAASGFLTDPVRNARLSVEAALSAGLVGWDFYQKLLSAEGAVKGYVEPFTGRKISLFQAMKKELLVKEHGIRLLEAQVATGGVIDPTDGRRLPVEVAHARGYLDEEMCRFLSKPENQTRSCFDPNTQENLTYLQLLRRCVPDPRSGLLMLHVMDKGSALFQLSEGAREALQAARTTPGSGPFQGQSVTLWELLFSRDVPDHRREELLREYKAGTVTIPEMSTILTTIVTGAEADSGGLSSSTATPNEEVEASQVVQVLHSQELSSSLISNREVEASKQLQDLHSQELSSSFISNREVEASQPAQDLHSQELSSSLIPNREVEASKQLQDLHSQELSSSLIPNREVEASKQLQDLHSQELSSSFISNREVEASQPAQDLHSQELSSSLILNREVEASKQLQDLHSQELSSSFISNREVEASQPAQDLHSQELSSTSIHSKRVEVSQQLQDPQSQEHQLRKSLKSVVIHVTAGDLQGQSISLLDLLFSKYIPQGKRQELLELYRAGILSTELVATVVTTIINRTEATSATSTPNSRSSHRAGTRAEEKGDGSSAQDAQVDNVLKSTTITVPAGELRGTQVSVWDLLFSDYIPEEKAQELLELHREGLLTLEQMVMVITTLIKKKESTGRRFLVTSKASKRDPVPMAGRKDSECPEEPWETALKATAVTVGAGQLRGRRVSVWELLHSKYIPEENRKELLELYQSGELTLEQVKTVVSTIVTKAEAARAKEPGCVRGPRAESVAMEDEEKHLEEDRSWEETLKATTVEVPVGEFQGSQVSVWDLLFSSSISQEKRQELLELHRAGMLPLERLVMVVTTLIKKKESTGRRFLVTSKASKRDPVPMAGRKDSECPREEEPWETALKATAVTVGAGQLRGRRVSVWELLHSKYIPEENRKELLELYQSGELTLEQVKTVVSTIVTKAEAARAKETGCVRGPRAESVAMEDEEKHLEEDRSWEETLKATTVEEKHLEEDRSWEETLKASTVEEKHLEEDRSWEETLKATTVEVPVGEIQGSQVSVWDLLFSSSISQEKRQELLELHRAGMLPLERLVMVVTTLIKKKESTGRRFLVTSKASKRDPVPAAGGKDSECPREEEPWETALKATAVTVGAGQLRGRRVSVWELLHSKYIPEENRKELLELYQSGELTLEQVKTVVSTIVTKAEAARAKEPERVRGPRAESVAMEDEEKHLEEDRSWEETLKATTVEEKHLEEDRSWEETLKASTVEEKHLEEDRSWEETLKASTVEEKHLEEDRSWEENLKASTVEEKHLEEDRSWEENLKASTVEEKHLEEDRSWEETLKATTVGMPTDEFQGSQGSVWDLLFSRYLPEQERQELLARFRAGTLTMEELLSTTGCVAAAAGERHLTTFPLQTVDILRSEGSYITFGQSQEQKVSVWELLCSKQVSEFRREAQLDSYGAGGLTVNTITVTTTVVTGPQRKERHHQDQ